MCKIGSSADIDNNRNKSKSVEPSTTIPQNKNPQKWEQINPPKPP